MSNPYFASGFSAATYLPSIFAGPEIQREDLLITTEKDEAKIKQYLDAQGLGYLTEVK